MESSDIEDLSEIIRSISTKGSYSLLMSTYCFAASSREGVLDRQ